MCLALVPIAILLPIAYCLLPIAFCLLRVAYSLLPIAYCLSPIAYECFFCRHSLLLLSNALTNLIKDGKDQWKTDGLVPRTSSIVIRQQMRIPFRLEGLGATSWHTFCSCGCLPRQADGWRANCPTPGIPACVAASVA